MGFDGQGGSAGQLLLVGTGEQAGLEWGYESGGDSTGLDLEELMRQRGGSGLILPCSAVQQVGYEEGLKWVVRDCEERLYWRNALERQKKKEQSSVEQPQLVGLDKSEPQVGTSSHR